VFIVSPFLTLARPLRAQGPARTHVVWIDPTCRPAFRIKGRLKAPAGAVARRATLSLVPIYDVHARFATLKDTEGRQINEAELERQLSAARERLSDYKGRAFGRLDDFIIGVEIDAESPEAARERWFNEIRSCNRRGWANQQAVHWVAGCQ